MKIIHIIKKKRLEKNWTQFDLEVKSGVPQSSISQIERGIRKYPSHENIKKIAKALDIKLEEFTD